MPPKTPPRKSLTPKQKETFEWIRDQILQNGVAPSVEEIGREFSISKGSVWHRTNEIIEKGWLKRDAARQRSLEVVLA